MEGIFTSLKGKKVLVTGSSRGIGKAIAMAFAQNGADVAVHCTYPNDAMMQTENELQALGCKYVALYGDLSKSETGAKLVEDTVKAFGGIDILVCNVSVQIRKPWLEITDEEMQLQTQVNFFSTIKSIQTAVPYMKEKGWGRVITIGSVQQAKPHPDMLIYSANKCAIYSAVQSIALQLASTGITVNNVAPGTIYTDRNTKVLQDEAYLKKVEGDIPMHFIGQPEDCAGAVLLLASDAGRYITGENLYVDGGKFM